jgi:Ca2+-dependent lipid-binding protein
MRTRCERGAVGWKRGRLLNPKPLSIPQMHLLEDGAAVQPATTREDAKEVTLTIAQLAGRALKAMDSSLFGAGTSDPYVTFNVAVGDNEDKAKRVQTKVIKKNCNPEWLDEKLELQVSLAEIEAGVLRVRVFDKDLVGADDQIGEVRVALSAVSANEFVAPRWLPILDESQAKTGEIRLQLALPPLAKPHQDDSSSSNVPSTSAPPAAPWVLNVHVEAARGLAVMDRGGTSDPYCTFQGVCLGVLDTVLMYG